MDEFTLSKLEFDRVRGVLARYCRCSLGRHLALRIGPSNRMETVGRWLNETSQMVSALRDFGLPPFGGISDITPELAKATPGGGAGGDTFSLIAATLEGAGNARAWAAALPENLELVREMALALPDFAPELAAIRGVIDARGEVMDLASETLARLRREIAASKQRIHDSIYSYIRRPEVSRILQNPVVTLHEDRFVLPVKAEHRGQLAGVVHRMSASGATVFIEPNESVELNNRLVELSEHERREVVRLLDELAIKISARRVEIAAALRTLAQIDLLSAKAQYAAQFEFVAPEMTQHGPLQLHQVRHPLLIEQEYQQETTGVPQDQRHGVVPIDVRLGADFDILIITGSNTGGKTVALKTVALAAVMAQSGLHIPAGRGSSLPVLSDVLLDVGDEQSLQQSLSTFGAHIRRVNNILRRADRNCLVLLDELGSGTDPDEGAAIGQAVLDELARLGCPAMVTTHLGVLKAYAFNHRRVDNASVEFDTRTLRPTYHLRIGEPGESHAITVASAMGMPRTVIEAARKYAASVGGNLRQAIRSTVASRRASEAARGEAHTARLAAQDAQRQYNARLEELNRLQERFANWLASLSEMKAGDEVNVPGHDRPGKLVRIQFNKQVAVVDMSDRQIEVPLAELMPQLGQESVRGEIQNLRQQMTAQARQAEEFRRQAQHTQDEYQKSLQQQRVKQQQYEAWLAAIGQAKVGQQVGISLPPGAGVLSEIDLPAGKAKVQTPAGLLELTVQQLFPQSGPFAPRVVAPARQAGRPPRAQPEDIGDRPMPRGHAAPKSSRQAVLAVPPGEMIYVVPFHKQATLVRFNVEKGQAVVCSGAFEMTVPIADLEPVRDEHPPRAPAQRGQAPHGPASRGGAPEPRRNNPPPQSQDAQPGENPPVEQSM